MEEIDNRKIADKFKEFLTPQKLRFFLKKECGNCKDKILFDPCIGSGQLLYNIDAKYKTGCDIQDRKEVNLKNGINEFILCDYITYNDDNLKYDYVITNYPFSLRATDEQEAYLKELWKVKKINRVLDEHFILKSFRKAEKGFYLCFLGISYRNSEKEFRKYLIDNNYVSKIYVLSNCDFEATNINILYLCLDKNKTNDKIEICIYDFKKKEEEQEIKTITNKDIIDKNYNFNIQPFLKKEEDDTIYVEDYEKAIMDYFLYENNIKKSDLDLTKCLVELVRNSKVEERKENDKGEKEISIQELNFSIIKNIIENLKTEVLKQLEYSKIFKEDFIDIKEYVNKQLKQFLFELNFK